MSRPDPTMPLERVVLGGRNVRLEPFDRSHATGLAAACAPRTTDLFTATGDSVEPTTPELARQYVDEALARWRGGASLPFAVIDVASDEVIGATRYLDVDMSIPRLEIGSTWYAPSVRGTVVNPECKLLLLEHAFEALGARVVTLRTSGFNHRSQRAITRLGARFDGMLRRHVVQRDGRLRDTWLYTILAEDWPDVRAGLERRRTGVPGTGTALEDVVVRRATPGDAQAWLDYSLRTREAFAPVEPIRGDDAYTLEAVRARIGPSDRRVALLAARGGRIVGHATIDNIARGCFQSATVGYAVDPELQGRGLASRLLERAVEVAFEELGLHRLEAGTLLGNRASRRVLEKLRFTYVGVSPRHLRIAGEWQDHALYARTREDEADDDR